MLRRRSAALIATACLVMTTGSRKLGISPAHIRITPVSEVFTR